MNLVKPPYCPYCIAPNYTGHVFDAMRYSVFEDLGRLIGVPMVLVTTYNNCQSILFECKTCGYKEELQEPQYLDNDRKTGENTVLLLTT